MNEGLQLAHQPEHFVGGRWHIESGSGPAPADPVLGAAELAGLLVAATHLGEQDPVDLPDQAERQWKAAAQPGEAMTHCGDGVRALPDIVPRGAAPEERRGGNECVSTGEPRW